MLLFFRRSAPWFLICWPIRDKQIAHVLGNFHYCHRCRRLQAINIHRENFRAATDYQAGSAMNADIRTTIQTCLGRGLGGMTAADSPLANLP